MGQPDLTGVSNCLSSCWDEVSHYLPILFHLGLQVNGQSLRANLTHTVVQTEFIYQLMTDYLIHVYRKILCVRFIIKQAQRQSCVVEEIAESK
jgi:hypothetical protein